MAFTRSRVRLPSPPNTFMSDRQSTDNSNVFSGEIDPDIAELIGEGGENDQENDQKPDFNDLFDDGEKRETTAEPETPDLKKAAFPEITKFEEAPKPFFADKNFYKKALSDIGEESHKIHALLTKFLKAEDPQDRSMHRSRLIPAYWNYLQKVAEKVYTELPIPKLLALRFGVLLPTLLSKEQRVIISKIIMENETGEPVYYMDEWLKKVAMGAINPSATDETKPAKRNENQRILSMIDKAKGQRDVQLGLLKSKQADQESLEKNLVEQAGIILKHENHVQEGLKAPYTDYQKSAISDANDTLKKVSNIDREIQGLFRELENAQQQLDDLKEKAENLGADAGGVDSSTITAEFNSARQMLKLCVGRQGNHFPILMKQYFRANLRDIGTRENVIATMAEVEQLDPGIFLRTFKRQTNRIVPHIILLPCYGDQGICWEPFERFNRATSRGRIAIPMYPKDLKEAVLCALADLRWQVAKEKAQHYWMEEGLTGKYYQWFTDNKKKGDVRESFIQDYILWITKESEGTQKLEREARGVFWRELPFPQEIKDKLKNRGFVYNDLHKKDITRSMSDGY